MPEAFGVRAGDPADDRPAWAELVPGRAGGGCWLLPRALARGVQLSRLDDAAVAQSVDRLEHTFEYALPMFAEGDKVRIGPNGVQIFQVTDEVTEDGRLVIMPVDAAPGAYPFPMRTEDLVAADSAAPQAD